MNYTQLQDKQLSDLAQLMFELRNGTGNGLESVLEDFDNICDLKDALKTAISEGNVNMIEVGNALSTANSGNTALADEIRDRIDDVFQEIQKESKSGKEYGED